jgi:hypothetical protein
MAVTSSDLGVYLGDPGIDATRATLLIGYATSLCGTIVTPLPTGADAVILDVAARAYVNASNVTQVGLGSGQVTFGSQGRAGGLYLTKSNKSTLRRLAGRSGAFAIDLVTIVTTP